MTTRASARKSAPIQRSSLFINPVTDNPGQKPTDNIPAEFYFLVFTLGIALLGAIVYSIVL